MRSISFYILMGFIIIGCRTTKENIVEREAPKPLPIQYFPIEGILIESVNKSIDSSRSIFPKVTTSISPIYPDIARRAGVEGTTTVKIIVDQNGIPNKVTVISSDVEIFVETCIQASTQWRFTPFQVDGKPKSFVALLRFQFFLDFVNNTIVGKVVMPY